MEFDVEGARKAGYSDGEIAEHLSKNRKFDSDGARKAGYSDSEIVSHLTQAPMTQAAPPSSQAPPPEATAAAADEASPNAGSVAERMAFGAFEPAVGGAQFVANALANDGVRTAAARVVPGIGPVMQAVEKLVGPQAFSEFKERQNRFATEVSEHQGKIAPEGTDWARLGGNAAGLIPAAALGGPAVVVGRATAPVGVKGFAEAAKATAPQAAGALRKISQSAARGAKVGGASGAAMPVAEADGGYAGEKIADVALGAGVGAVLNPATEKLVGAIGTAMSGLRAAIKPKMSPAEIKVRIIQNLKRSDVDFSKLPQGYVDDVTREVQTALQAGANLDESTLTNIAVAKTLGVDLTRGQASQQPGQYAKEMFLRQGQGGEGLQTQYVNSLTRLNQNLDEVGRGKNMQPPLLNVEAGRRALDALREADKPARDGVSRLYDAARGMVGLDELLDQAKLVNSAFDRLQEAGVVDKLPGQFVTALNQMSTGKAALTMREAQMMIRAANGRIGSTVDPVERKALQIFKSAVDDAVEGVGSQAGQDASTAFRLARDAASKRFQRMDQIPILKEAVDGDMAPDDFMRRGVYNAKLDDLKAMRAYLRSNNKPAWNQIRSQVLEDFKLAATGGSDDPAAFSQAAFNKQLRSMKQSGKLGLMFSPSEINTLEAVGRVGRLIQAGPPGVLRTGAMGAAQGMDMLMGILSRLPLLGRAGGLAAAMGRKGANTLEATASLKAPDLAPMVSAIPPEVSARLAAQASALPAIELSRD
ncbi:MAG: hypothetical protein Q8L99_04595 [Polycyclovorans sp.]|nr:hypothetical protein [Polycyclovorans sp.]